MAITHDELQDWIKHVENYVRDTRPNVTLTAMHGKKYIRIVEEQGAHHRSVFCFIDANSGDILKADGWSRPAKGARGNIRNEFYSIGKGVTPYGAAYAR